MPNSQERFTQRARRILYLAQNEAETLRHRSIGTEHVLIGLMRDEGGVAFHALKACGIEDAARIRELTATFSKIPTTTSDVELDLTSECKKMLELSVDAARRIGNHFIGTEHLLLGIMGNKKSTAYQMLIHLGIQPDQVRQQVKELVKISNLELPQTPIIDAKPEQEVEYPEAVRRVFELARAQAERLQSKELEPEHLMLALLETEDADTFNLFRQLGIERPIDSVRSAAVNVPKRKEQDVLPKQLAYSHATQTALAYVFRYYPTDIASVTPKALLIGLTRFDWVLVRLWSVYNIDAHTLQSALAHAGLGIAPPPRRSFQGLHEYAFVMDIVKLFRRIFRLKSPE